jgi:ATP-dependent Clp protease protease subunit
MSLNNVVHLIGEVNDDMFSKLLEGLEQASKKQALKLIINTGGGCDATAIAMYDMIRQYDNKVRGVAVGSCLSAGTLLLLACDERACTENTEFLFHYGDGTYDNLSQLKLQVRRAKKWDELVAERTARPIDEVTRWHKRETYMTALQALHKGVVHSIVELGSK